MAKSKVSNMKNNSQETVNISVDTNQVDIEDQIQDEEAVKSAEGAPRLKKRKGKERTITIDGVEINNDYLANTYALSPSKCEALVDSYISKGKLLSSDFV